MHCCQAITGDVFFAVWVNLGYFYLFTSLADENVKIFKKKQNNKSSKEYRFTLLSQNLWLGCFVASLLLVTDKLIDGPTDQPMDC